MKTCKKILAGILVFAMMMSMCAFVSADGTTTETTVTSKLLFTNNFDEKTVGDTLNSGSSWKNSPDDSAGSSSVFYAKGGAPANKLNTTTVLGDATNKYISTTHNRLGYNVYKNNNACNTLGYSADFSVLSASYDIMIPADDTYKANRRYAFVQAGTYTTGKYNTFLSEVSASITDGKITGSATNSTELYSNAVDYTYGEWVTIKIDAWINADKGINSAVYADGTLVYAGEYSGTNTAVGMACNLFEFMYANTTNGTTATSTAATSGIESVTCYDNIKVSFLTADNEVTEEEIEALKPNGGEVTSSGSVVLTLDADGNVDVEASKSEGSLTSGILVVALYDAGGKVIDIIIPENALNDGKFVYEVSAETVATASMIKGFVFDGITTAVPQLTHGVLEIN